jgi:hypothetical protein
MPTRLLAFVNGLPILPFKASDSNPRPLNEEREQNLFPRFVVTGADCPHRAYGRMNAYD